ncbi:helix-turn-helix transcriptional regulator [Viridibacillus sp. NPDC096237]|uniref:helix-turn-helix transcriptional regulator n=1 Tax=Viridibacillus sp. NPDC096237 TaxID=3390721 RepID=UPI003CFE6748
MKNTIQVQRKTKGLSQEELAQKCKVSRQTINAIENDKYDPSLQLAFALAYVLEHPIEKLFIFKYERDDINDNGKKS